MPLRALGVTALLVGCLCWAASAAARVPGATTAQLALMPLPLAAYGGEARGLKLNPDESGPIDNAKAADDSTDRNDTAASLSAAGRITGYELSFAALNLIGKPGNLVYANSEISLYRSAKAAAVGLRRELADAIASDPANGLRVVSSSRFAVSGVGDEAAGVVVGVKIGLAKAWLTGVVARRDDLVELVGLVRTDAQPEQAPVAVLARALAARVEGVIGGTITTPPAKLPSPTTKPKQTVVPKVKIDDAALTSSDLNGAKVTRAEYVADSDAVASYEREFSSTSFGKSRLLNVESDVKLYRSAAQAAFFFAGIRGVLNPDNSSFKRFFASAFSSAAGFEVKSLTVLRHREYTLPATRAVEVAVRVVTPFGPVDTAFAFMLDGRFAGAVILTGAIGKHLDLTDLARVEGIAAKRIRLTAKRIG